MWDLIDELVAGGMTTLLTTQYLEEADRLAHQIAVIDHGVVIERGTPEELTRRVGGEQIDVLVTRADDLGRVHAALAGFATGEPHYEKAGRRVVIPVGTCAGWCPRWCGASTRPASRSTTWACGSRPSTTCSSP